MVLVEAITFILAVTILVKGADFFVQAASDIATRMGASQLVVGLTIVAIGTSIPELASSVAAALAGSHGLIIGGVVGSNIANIALIGGVAAILTDTRTYHKMLVRDGYIMLFAAAMLYLFMIDGRIILLEAFVFVLLYIAYLVFVVESRTTEDEKEYNFKRFFGYFMSFRYLNSIHKQARGAIQNAGKGKLSREMIRDATIILLSGTAVVFGAKFTIQEALYFANLLGVPEAVIGITMIALGTSLPELTVTVAAARKGFGEIVIGNVMGSNIANVLLVLGVTGLIQPILVSGWTLVFSAPFMLLLSVLFLLFVRTRWEVERAEGIVLLGLYVAFLVAVIAWPVIAG